LRPLEAACTGAAMLGESHSTVPVLSALCGEMLTFHDIAEFVDQATWLSDKTSMSTWTGDAAARGAHRDPTCNLRLATIVEKVA